ncbi:hypothetical protein K488DRAFT_77114 [Vararia minispora EC-137]|uniref:Uncharacterized protein n=1 Tax=Vararia minispora EC-137 TaxID=1314806 RepID=A0ACB8QT49_9AGAM|nr:hypothetical protein K488DRAFT_77114 [Vararia minispora EC-137]
MAAFVVQDLAGRGKGAVALRDIQRGELVIREQPLFRVPSSINVSPTKLLHSLLSDLTDAERATFYDLSFVNMPSQYTSGSPEYKDYLPLAIFQTNAVSAGEEAAGIFPRMARLNHGCSFAFNVVYSWRDDEGVLVELLTAYMDTKRARAERQHALREGYAFECKCSCCSLPIAESTASDARLTFMSELYRAFATWSDGQIGARKAADIARRIWHIGEQEGYVSERGRLAADVAYVAAAVSDDDAVRQWAKLGAHWARIELGNSSALSREMEGVKEKVMGPRDIVE